MKAVPQLSRSQQGASFFCFVMTTRVGNFAAYELVQIDTGIPLYTTTATPSEIIEANANLKARHCTSRYYPAGSFYTPSLHF